MIAEDMQQNDWLTKAVSEGGAGFGAQWDASFVREIRHLAISSDDQERSLSTLANLLTQNYNDAAYQRVIFSESHDAVANGDARVPEEIEPDDPGGWFSQKRSTLAASIVFTAPGIPMIFQGQEFMEAGWFRDYVAVDWDQREDFHGILRMYRDLISLRLNRDGTTGGLASQFIQVVHVNDQQKVITFRRGGGGPGNDVMVVANFAFETRSNYTIGFPSDGLWSLRFNSDWRGYSDRFEGIPSADVTVRAKPYDGMEYQGEVAIGPYSTLIYSQSPE